MRGIWRAASGERRAGVGVMAIMVLMVSSQAHAQLGNILKKVDPRTNPAVGKAIKVGREAAREFTEEEELNIGRIVAARVLATYPLAGNEKVQKYVTLVGNTVAAYSSRPTLEWHFAVIDSPVVNAYSAPAGYIFITTGALKQIHSEAELASVLAHEVAHATQKHILKEVKRSNVMSASVDFAQSTSSGSWLNDEMAKKIGEVAYSKLFTTGLSRRDEEEADRIAVQLADAAGYRAAELMTFLHGLESIEGSSEMKVLTATHPRPKDRIATVKPLVKADHGELLAERWEAWTR